MEMTYAHDIQFMIEFTILSIRIIYTHYTTIKKVLMQCNNSNDMSHGVTESIKGMCFGKHITYCILLVLFYLGIHVVDVLCT